jgi:hypothetical protein
MKQMLHIASIDATIELSGVKRSKARGFSGS